MTARIATGIQGLPRNATHDEEIDFINQLADGRINNAGLFTLTANAGSSVITDSRIGGTSYIAWEPTTAHASAEIAAGGIYVSSQAKGTCTLTHANNAQTDRIFRLVILG